MTNTGRTSLSSDVRSAKRGVKDRELGTQPPMINRRMKMFSNMKAAIVKRYKEMKLQLTIRFKDGRDELALYRLERDHGMSILWVPSKKQWVRARALYWGQKNVLVQFVDGEEKTGYRSPLSIRRRDPVCRQGDKPSEDAKYSGNRGHGNPAWLHDMAVSGYRTSLTVMRLVSAMSQYEGGTHG